MPLVNAIGIHLLFSNYRDSIRYVHRIYLLSSRTAHFSCAIHAPNRHTKSFLFCPRSPLFVALFYSCRNKSVHLRYLRKMGGGGPLSPHWLHVSLEVRHHSHDRSCGAILFSRGDRFA